MIRFGAWSSVLLLLALQVLVLALLLWRAPGNRRANRALAGLMIVVAGLLTPYILGFAGAYDAAPWLTNAPFAVPLAVGPLLYAHVVALAENRGIARWHWLAPALQFGWQAALFPLPTATKWRIDAALIEPVVAPLGDVALLISMSGYGIAAWRCLGTYRLWLEGQRRVDRPARRIRLMILLLVPLIAARAAYSLFQLLVRPTDYFDFFGYYLLLGATALGLGLAGWRQADRPAPAARDEEEARAERGREWLARTRTEGWTRDPALTLEGLARKLGTNRADLSYALAPHGGFAAAMGGIRAEAVAAALTEGSGDDLLTLALAAGFGSKASFNRAFRARFGVSPSRWRGGAGSAAGAVPTN